MNDNKQSFVFYGSWLDDMDDMTADERLEYYEAIIQYGLTGEVKEVSRYVRGRMIFVRKDIDENKSRYAEVSNARAEAGKKGAEKRWQKMANDSKNSNVTFATNSTNSKNGKDSINDNDNVNDNVLNKKEIILLFPKKKDDANHNTSRLVEVLRGYEIDDAGIQRICELCDYGVIGHPIWKLLAKRMKKINETYILNYLKAYSNEQVHTKD